MPRLLIVTAVPAERDAVCAGLGSAAADRRDLVTHRSAAGTIDVAAGGGGPPPAAAGTARLLATAMAGGDPYDGVVSAGIAGGIEGRAGIGDVVAATASIAADLGAESPDGFLPIDTLGFGTGTLPADPTLLAVPVARVGTILTVTTVTGTAGTAATLAARHPDALAEAMEGFGVATAASQAGVGFGEIRAISNLVGVRDRAAWRLRDALDALTATFAPYDRTAAGPPPPHQPG